MHRIGGSLLQQLMNADGGGYCGTEVECGKGHRAEFIDYRKKEITTVLSPVQLQRAYYYCKDCNSGVIPKDQELDIVDTFFSPGVRRMMGQVGAKEAFEEGRRDLERLAGIKVSSKAVERISEGLGQQIEELSQQEQAAILLGEMVAFERPAKLYICVDATGIPVVVSETKGRKGKDPTIGAKTREVKLGCVFSQTSCDAEGNPVRDKNSTTYAGCIETSEAFGWRIYAEALRRGLAAAEKVIFIGDAAAWIWKIAEEHFPGAVQIVDLYHAREHLANLGKAAFGQTKRFKIWTKARYRQLDRGNIRALIRSLLALQAEHKTLTEEIRKAIEYFQNNAHRMRFAKFRQQGFFVGSGVVEAGCKTVIGQRLKQSGMHWTVRGANNIIALRCLQQSGRWEEFWELRSTRIG